MVDLQNVRVHNLKSISLSLPARKLICFTGVSGSGKSSLAFDTIYIEGQRRYVESLSQHARRFIGDLPKPDVDAVTGITPTISIEQKTAGKNPRSTIGTITEIYDYLRVLYARAGIAYCPVSGERVSARGKEEIIQEIQRNPAGKKLILLAPYIRGKKGELKDDIEALIRKGFTRVRIDGKIELLTDEMGLDKSHAHDLDIVIDRFEVQSNQNTRIAESVTIALQEGGSSCIVLDHETNDERLYSTKAYSQKSGLSYEPLDPQDFSFNSPQGMCEECQGMGMKHEYALEKIIDEEKSIQEDCCLIASSYQTVRYGNIYNNLARLYDFDISTPWKKLSDRAKKVFLYGTEKKWTRMRFVHPVTGAFWNDLVAWRGVLHEAYDKYQKAKSEGYKRKQEALMKIGICPACKGARIKAYPAACRFHEKTIFELVEMTIGEALNFFSTLSLSSFEVAIAKELISEIIERLTFLQNVGLDYLQLSRTAPTLSGGESQRVRLASQIGSGLVGVTYVLDEPSIGLHPRDNKKLISSLQELRDKNNTVIVVEHDEETIFASDHVVDFGPKAGIQGGNIIYSGDVQGLLKSQKSLTGAFLSKREKIDIPEKRRQGSNKKITLSGCTLHNLKNVTLELPLGKFIAITGLSGSGKSSLFLETLFPALSNALMKSDLPVGAYTKIDCKAIDKVIEIDQSPIGRTPRSNPATYVGIFDEIRKLYAKLPQSLAKGYLPGRFSFNVKEGSCPECKGLGMIKIDMDFLEASWVECPHCHGHRFDEETLSIRFKEKNIRDVLDMDINEALEHFANIPWIQSKLSTLKQVGLDYIKLGQSSTTLSGGEAQRIKLARELSRPATGNTLYILDEPTTGLHFYDTRHLLKVLHALVDRGNSVVVIEHNMDLVKTADLVIDMGPGSGSEGGYIIATGTPEEMAKKESPTGEALREVLSKKKSGALKKKKLAPLSTSSHLIVEGAKQNNLQSINVKIPHEKLTVVTGPSGSGKSSLAFETIYAEGQRRYVESLSPYVRQFVKQCAKPKMDDISGLLPTVAIEQRLHAASPRSTVGTMTEVYDYLRILYSRIGIPHCPKTGFEIRAISKEHVVEKILSYPVGEKLQILAPIEMKRTDAFLDVLARLQKLGFLRIRLNNQFYELGVDTPVYDPKRKNELFLVIDRLKVDPSQKMRFLEAVATAEKMGNGKIIVMREEGDVFFNLTFAVVETGESYPEITPQTFAFNTPQGACPECQGLGFIWGIDLLNLPITSELTDRKLLDMLWGDDASIALKLFKKIKLSKHATYNGSEMMFSAEIDGVPFRFSWRGINTAISDALRYHKGEEDLLPEEWAVGLKENRCGSCNGARLNALARHVTINQTSIVDFVNMPLTAAQKFIENLTINAEEDRTLKQVYDELRMRLSFLNRIGLTYLSLGRSAPTLSGGEAQRVRLARQIGSGLTSVLYVLDEPTIGLHPQDSVTLMDALSHLKAAGNSLLVVEHDPQIIMKADHVIELGPCSGKDGGKIVAQGSPQELLRNSDSLTGKYLQKRPLFKKPRKKKKEGNLSVIKANEHNLKDLTLNIPLYTFTALTGVSGSGKSTLLFDVILKNLRALPGNEEITDVIVIDQKPMGHTLRSDVASYTDVLTPMRTFFASLPEAKVKGLEPKHFSAYHRKGMCSTCYGLGYKRIEMHFLPAVKVPCPECHGLRLNSVSLTIRYQEKNLGEILQLTCDEALALFTNHPRIKHKLEMLHNVGLGYLKLGQEMQTLSGGEAQRMKLSYELAKRSKGHTLYLLDEPTTGLHPQEIETVIALLQKLIEKGHTVIAIEHNLDFIAQVDEVIDLGPGAGDEGGSLVFQGPPEALAKNPNSLTGKFLA